MSFPTTLSPILLFVYNRPWHTRQTLEALKQNRFADESLLIIFSDGPRDDAKNTELQKIMEVRALLREDRWCEEVQIIERKKNLGLAASVIEGVTTVINKYGKVIVLEDDIVTSEGFLDYMNKSLSYYEDVEKVMHISGYFPPVKRELPDFFFYNQTSCWGWGTWKHSWAFFNKDPMAIYNLLYDSKRIFEFNLDNSYPFLSHLEANLNGTLNTWAIKWHSSVFLERGLCLHPNKSYVQNIGLDNSGENCISSSIYSIDELNTKEFKPVKDLKENKNARKAIINFNRSNNMGEKGAFKERIKNFFKSLKECDFLSKENR